MSRRLAAGNLNCNCMLPGLEYCTIGKFAAPMAERLAAQNQSWPHALPPYCGGPTHEPVSMLLPQPAEQHCRARGDRVRERRTGMREGAAAHLDPRTSRRGSLARRQACLLGGAGDGLICQFLHDAPHWRTRAEEFRVLAERLTDPEARTSILRIAEEYDKLAKRAETRVPATVRS